jgi:hypothetical protein
MKKYEICNLLSLSNFREDETYIEIMSLIYELQKLRMKTEKMRNEFSFSYFKYLN